MHLKTLFFIICLVGSMHCSPRRQKRADEETVDVSASVGDKKTTTTTAETPSKETTSSAPPNSSTGAWPDVNSWVDNIGQNFKVPDSETWSKPMTDVSTWFNKPSLPSWLQLGVMAD